MLVNYFYINITTVPPHLRYQIQLMLHPVVVSLSDYFIYYLFYYIFSVCIGFVLFVHVFVCLLAVLCAWPGRDASTQTPERLKKVSKFVCFNDYLCGVLIY